MGEVSFLAVFAGVAGYYFYETLGYTVSKFDRTGGPALFPQILVIGFIFVIAIRIVQILITKEKVKFRFLTILKGPRGVFFLSFLAYVVVLPIFGFLVSGSLYLVGLSKYMFHQVSDELVVESKPNFIRRSIFLVLLIIAMNLFFPMLLKVEVPRGFWA